MIPNIAIDNSRIDNFQWMILDDGTKKIKTSIFLSKTQLELILIRL